MENLDKWFIDYVDEFRVSCILLVEAFQRCTQTDESIRGIGFMFCFVCTIFLGSRVTWLGVFFLEYNVYNESWEYSLFSIEGSSAREKKRERAMP